MVHTWQWVSLLVGLLLAAFFASAETALTALGEARVRHLIDSGGWRGSLLRLWQKHPERILSTQLTRPLTRLLLSRLDARTASYRATRELLQGFFPGDYRVIQLALKFGF